MEKRPEVVNFLKAINFQRPERIPAVVSLLPATWLRYQKELEKLVLKYPELFPHYQPGNYLKLTLPRHYRKGRWQDVWKVTWEGLCDGLANAPVESLAPLRDWDTFDTFVVPDPLAYNWYGEKQDWQQIARSLKQAKAQGYLASGGLPHGFMYMRLYYLRGFTNFMVDIATHEPRLEKLISVVTQYNVTLVEKWLSLGVEIMNFGDDLGLQKSLPISPDDWRRYLKPSFQSIFQRCRKQQVLVSLHTDGYILDIIPDLIECGVSLLNPQIRPNTLSGIREFCQGRVAIRLDLDRQLFPFSSPKDIRAHILEGVKTLALPEGGLLLNAECGPDVPLTNIAAICETLNELKCLAG
ncbi:MAG: hypothetical protein NC911_02100 [Candidatus Omnitrophica bacterium]|nr:hypothetical protein [Candidatus Omnitrophota bacterium]